MKRLIVWCLLTAPMWFIDLVRMACSVFRLREYRGWFGAYEGGFDTCWIALVERRKDLQRTLCYLLALLTPPCQLRLYFDSLSQDESLHSLRRAMFVRSRHFPIREVCPPSDSPKDALVRWIRWHSKWSYLYHSNETGTRPPQERLKEFLRDNGAPHLTSGDLVNVIVTERVPTSLMEELVRDCWQRFHKHPLDSFCPDDHLIRLLGFLKDQTYPGFTTLREQCVLIAFARSQILENVHHVEALQRVASEANPYRAVDVRKMLTDGAPVSKT
ncbi:MAG: hypothetical protein AAB447_01670 [Patescibacteria group bacterium]